MSRCFPFPPPGYTRNNSEALINSFKLREEKEKAKKDRKEKKEKKKEKKERRKEKKERKLKEVGGAVKKLKLTDGKFQKVEDVDNEQFERSGITEELDQHVSSREPCCLSDSSQSSKRKRKSSSHDHGPPIKIRLPLRKHTELEELKSRSSSAHVGNADSFTQDVVGPSDHQFQSISNMDTEHIPGNSDSGHCKTLQNLVPADTQFTNEILDDESQRVASLYHSLLQIPPLTIDGFHSADEDWLFGSDLTVAKPVSRKSKYDSEAAFQCSKSMWPRAQYLPEVEIYALPYVVPF